MTPAERGLRFDCAGESLVGVLTLPAGAATDVGVVIAVGGPQYRAGSHRQFVLMARRLAAAGHAVLRFDARGMGDSSGEFPGFEDLGPDLAAAVQALRAELPAVRRVVLWGLCDAASAALLNAAALPGLAGLVLLNPWVRHVDTHASTEVRQYYARRLVAGDFWRKLLAGRVRLGTAAGELSLRLWRMLRAAARRAGGAPAPADFRERMARAALGFAGPQLYILSGRDHVCAEFLAYSGAHPRLRGLWARAGVERVDFVGADHTFSSRALRAAVEEATLDWLRRLPDAGRA
jgi:exosortase A-associated hydrolase 1